MHLFIPILTGIFFSILFIQSGLDKVFNWKSELEFNKTHFAKTFVNTLTPAMLVVLTLMELSSGLMSATGMVMVFIKGDSSIAFIANLLCSVTFITLFFGQRIAKDYGGAQSLVSYFILSLIGLYFSYSGCLIM